MKNIQREDIYLIQRHSNLGEEDISDLLQENIYADADAWKKFIRLLFLILGTGFALAGIIFFFAYNWADLHKFIKLGIVESLVLVTTILSLLPQINMTTKKVILMGGSVLIGVLFAVFGQIYQTGANAYDFFLAWTIFIAIWVIVSNFAPLWLMLLFLVNITLMLYKQQVAAQWSSTLLYGLLFVLNGAVLVCTIGLNRYKPHLAIPLYFKNIVAIAAIASATIGVSIGIFERDNSYFPVLVGLVLITYAMGIRLGFKYKSMFYLAALPFSLIIMITCLLFDFSEDKSMLLAISIFIIASVTLIVRNLIQLQKSNRHEN